MSPAADGPLWTAVPDPTHRTPDALVALDRANGGRVLATVPLGFGEGLHELCRTGRFVVAPGALSSRVHVLDASTLAIAKVIPPRTLVERTGCSAPHRPRCGPDGILLSMLAGAGREGCGGIALLDRETFDVLGSWERNAWAPCLHGDLHWLPRTGALLAAEWGTPAMLRPGLDLGVLAQRRYGHALLLWDMRRRRLRQRLDLGNRHQMVTALVPRQGAPSDEGFAATAIDAESFGSAIWHWRIDDAGVLSAQRVISLRAERVAAQRLPPVLRALGARPPLVTALELAGEHDLLVACWGTGELRRYDVRRPEAPSLLASLQLAREGGAMVRAGPARLTVDGDHVYVTNAFRTGWDAQFHPAGAAGRLVRIRLLSNGGLELDHGWGAPIAGRGMVV